MTEDDSKGLQARSLGSALQTAASAVLDLWTQSRSAMRLKYSANLKDGRVAFYVRKDASEPALKACTFVERYEHEAKQYADPNTYWSLMMQNTCSLNKVIALALAHQSGLTYGGKSVEKVECLDLTPSEAAMAFVRGRVSVTDSVKDAPEPTSNHSVILFRVAPGKGDLIFDVSCAQYGEFSRDLSDIPCPTVLRALGEAEYMEGFIRKDSQSLDDVASELETMAKTSKTASEYLAFSKAAAGAASR